MTSNSTMSPVLRSTRPPMTNYFQHCLVATAGDDTFHDSPVLESCVRKKKLFDIDIVELLLTKGGGMERNTAFVLYDCLAFADLTL